MQMVRAGRKMWWANVAVVVVGCAGRVLWCGAWRAIHRKFEARRRVREAQARANEARAQRERANVEDAATVMVAAGKVREVDAWETERLAQLREQVRAEANKRRADHRVEAGVAIVRMQQRGETMATIAELAGAGIGEIRALLRFAPKGENHTATAASGALGGGGDGAGSGVQRGAARAAAAGEEQWTNGASPELAQPLWAASMPPARNGTLPCSAAVSPGRTILVTRGVASTRRGPASVGQPGSAGCRWSGLR